MRSEMPVSRVPQYIWNERCDEPHASLCMPGSSGRQGLAACGWQVVEQDSECSSGKDSATSKGV